MDHAPSGAGLPPPTFDRVREALSFVSPDCAYDDWIAIGFALASEFGDAGFDLFDDWSAGAASYNQRTVQTKWRSLVKSARAESSIGVVFRRAIDAGYRPRADEQDRRKAEEERARRREAARLRAAAEEAQRQEDARRAAMSASERWAAAARSGESLYLRRKLIDQPESIRFEPNGTILVPMVRYDLPRDQALVGVQAIRADGSKLFGSGTAKRGAACRLGLVVEGEPIFVGEGYATGMSVRMAVERRWPVFVAFDAGNLEPVVEMLRAAHPRCPIVICADDDWRTIGNPGRSKAAKLARRLDDVHIAYPVWPGHRGERETDFNDLHRAAGLNVVARQLRAGLQLLGVETVRAA